MTTTIDPDTIRLARGSHRDCEDGMCLFEGYNVLKYGTHTDRCPDDVSPVLHRFGLGLNDALPDEPRQRLAVYLPRPGRPSPLDGTAGDGLDEVCRHMAVDWSVRVVAPLWLDAAGRLEVAAELRGWAPITDAAGRAAAGSRLREIADECWAARREALAKAREQVAAAAADAAYDAAAAAAYDAAYDAAAVAAAVAVADAAAAAVAAAVAFADADADAVAAAVAFADADADAAAAAAWSETYNRVYRDTKARLLERYAPVAEQVHTSAIGLFARMIRPVQG